MVKGEEVDVVDKGIEADHRLLKNPAVVGLDSARVEHHPKSGSDRQTRERSTDEAKKIRVSSQDRFAGSPPQAVHNKKDCRKDNRRGLGQGSKPGLSKGSRPRENTLLRASSPLL